MTEEGRIRVAVSGAGGRMGQEVVRALLEAPDLALVAALDPRCAGQDAAELAGLPSCGLKVVDDVDDLVAARPQVLVDFTQADVSPALVRTALAGGAHCVVGTTGLSEEEVVALGELADQAGRGLLVAPNFALGAVLMMRFAAEAARYFAWAEIIEMHHENKLDAPSGTAMRTAQLMRSARSQPPAARASIDKVAGARGADVDGIRLHSVRLPGLVAHQEVLLGGPGETLTIRHDSLSRASFMPGVLLAVRQVLARRGLLLGLEAVLEPG